MKIRTAAFYFLVCMCCYGQPTIGGVTNAATFTGSISPGSLAAIFGTGLASSTASAASIPLPVTLGGATVTIGGITCPMLYASSTQINLQIPWEVPPGAATLTITVGSASNTPLSIYVGQASPGIFQSSDNRAAAENLDGSLNDSSHPVASGSVLVAFLNGIGPVSPAAVTGAATPVQPLTSATLTFSATIGGVNAPVQFLGLVSGLVGLGQANIQVPALPTGDYPLVIVVGGAISTSAIVSISGSGTAPAPVLTLLATAGLTPATIQPLGSGVTDVAVEGTDVYVCDPYSISIIDVTTPSAPQVVGSFGQSDLNGLGSNCRIEETNLVEVIDSNSVIAWSLTTPSQPERLSDPVQLQFNYVGNVAFSGTTGFFVTDSATYFVSSGQITAQEGEFFVTDFTVPQAPQYLGNLVSDPTKPITSNASPRFAVGLFTNTAVVLGTTSTGSDPSGGQAQFTILDVTNPAGLVVISQTVIPQAAVLTAIASDGNLGLLAGNTKGWANPVSLDPVTNDVALGFDGTLTLTTVNFNVPQSPSVIATIDTGIQSADKPFIAALGNSFFAISIGPPPTDLHGPSTLAVIDVRDQQNPVVTPVAVIQGLQGLAVIDDNLYAATEFGLNVYQISTP